MTHDKEHQKNDKPPAGHDPTKQEKKNRRARAEPADHRLEELTRWLERRDYNTGAVARFTERWRQRRRNDPGLCPQCFLDPKEPRPEQPLALIDEAGRIETLACAHCGNRYYVPQPDAPEGAPALR